MRAGRSAGGVPCPGFGDDRPAADGEPHAALDDVEQLVLPGVDVQGDADPGRVGLLDGRERAAGVGPGQADEMAVAQDGLAAAGTGG